MPLNPLFTSGKVCQRCCCLTLHALSVYQRECLLGCCVYVWQLVYQCKCIAVFLTLSCDLCVPLRMRVSVVDSLGACTLYVSVYQCKCVSVLYFVGCMFVVRTSTNACQRWSHATTLGWSSAIGSYC